MSASSLHRESTDSLIYSRYAHYDNDPSFNDYLNDPRKRYQFGGWKKPTMKQYKGDVTECGKQIDKNWRP